MMTQANKVGDKIIINQNTNPTSKENFQISSEGNRLIISIDKDWLSKTSSYDINKMLMIATSPFFTNKQKQIPEVKLHTVSTNVKQMNKGYKHIAFFIENKPYYTGGRYSIWMQAAILSNYTDVTVVTNMKPVFYDDFKDYYTPNFKMIVDEKYLADFNKNDFDIIVGVPNLSGQYATEYSERWNLTLYLVLFESPNYVSAFREGEDGTEEYWSGYKQCLKKADKVILPSHESAKWFEQWDEDFKGKSTVIYPCINEAVFKKYSPDSRVGGKPVILYSTRVAPFKNPLTIFKKIKDKYEIHVIGKVWAPFDKELKKAGVILHGTVSDERKCELLSMCDVFVFPSQFEGFGMPPAEALYYSKPVVAYDLPVLREVYGNVLNLVPMEQSGNVELFIDTLDKVVRNTQNRHISLNKYIYPDFTAKVLKELFQIPEVTTGTIIADGEEYLECAINSIKNYVSQIIIVHGNVKGFEGDCSKSLDVIDKLVKSDSLYKIEVHKSSEWEDKIEMQNQIANNVIGEYYIKLDSDEIWKPENLKAVIQMMIDNPEITVVKLPFYHFWINFHTIVNDAGGKWNTKHPRVWRWKKGFQHIKSFNVFNDTTDDIKPVQPPFFQETVLNNCHIYHFGYVRKPEGVRNKLKYYSNRNIESFVNERIYMDWEKMDDPTQPTQNVRSWAENFKGVLPEILNKHPYINIQDIRKEN